jgi:mannose-1-phosphate guanylyltransferase / mannose-6-phosphate isomerase
VTFGVKPSAPEIGYGYIKAGAGHFRRAGRLPGRALRRESQTAPRRRPISKTGGYYWNSGMFLFRAQSFIAEMERLEPTMLAFCRDAIAHAHRDLDFIRLGEVAFLACPSQSIDYAVMEHATSAAVVPVEMGWSDVGSWQSLWDIAPHRPDGNSTQGDVIVQKSRGSYIRSEGPLVAAVGVENLVVVATKDAVLVCHRDSAQDVKQVVEELEAKGRDHHIYHAVVNRPWGSYEGVDAGDRFQVKRIIVKPGAKLSLQMHHHRAEHWVVVSGTALVTCDDRQFLLPENESTFIPQGARHRLENPGKVPLHLIEVQSGGYLGEDDIVRFEDNYGRAPQSKNTGLN